MTTRLDALERLANLKDRGLLTDDEVAREKAALFGETDEPRPLNVPARTDAEPASDLPSPPPDTDSDRKGVWPYTAEERRENREKQKAFDKRLWSLERIDSLDNAVLMLGAGWFAVVLIVVNGIFDVGADIWTAANGGVVNPELTNGDALIFHSLGWLIWSAIVIATGWGAATRRNRFAAAGLVVLAGFELIASLEARWS